MKEFIRTILLTAMLLGSAVAAERKSIVVLPFELVDSSQGGVPLPDRVERLSRITDQLRKGLEENNLYTVVHNNAIQEEINKQLVSYDLRTCNGCYSDIAAVAGTKRVMVAWVQMVSNLILNINIEVRDGVTNERLLNKSADIRGNDFKNWQRGVRYILRSMVDKGQGNR